MSTELYKEFLKVRKFTESLCEPLETEDFVIQSMTDMSPTKWHLAHTTWFFEEFILKKFYNNYKVMNELYSYLFNSYYVQAGERFSRPHRGLLSRPTVKEVMEYRNYIDKYMVDLLQKNDDDLPQKLKVLIEIGLNHEQQHQELIITDLKHLFSINPLYPVYKRLKYNQSDLPDKIDWLSYEGGIYEIGYSGNGFYYDNEKPKHKTYLNNFLIADRLVTNREYIEFINDDGYFRPELWLSDGYAMVDEQKWVAPLYWKKIEDQWMYYTLNGFREVVLDEAVCHISHFEADAFARWANARLATEAEWEFVSKDLNIEGNFVDDELFHPVWKNDSNKVKQMFGTVWEWTQSNYLPYPGYKTPKGAIGEYNGKFMSGQMVLRGGSCATSKDHIRKTYRNFFHPHLRWQFSGIRLAKDF